LTVDESDNPDTFDPGVAITGQGEEVVSNVNFSPIEFASNPGFNTYVPVLAKSWTQSADGLTYNFTFRSNVYYSNGDPFNAYVVWYNVYRNLFLNQPIDGPLSLGLNTTGVTVDDVNKLNSSQNTPGPDLLKLMQNPHNAVTVIDKNTVQFHLYTAFLSFLQVMPAGPPWTMVDPYMVAQHGGVVANTPNSWMVVHGSDVGDGPYVVKEYIPNQHTILVANPHYWAQNLSGSDSNYMLHPARIPTIIINYKTDELTRALDVESGKSQASVISFSDINNVLKASNTVYVPNFGPGGTIEWLMIDTEKAPTNNILVRRAIISAINLTEVRATVFQGYTTPVVGPDLVGFFGYNNSIKPPAYNLTLAKQLLAQAGYPNGQGMPALTFAYPTSAYYSLLAQILVQDLGKIGITLKPSQSAVSTYLGLVGCCGNRTDFPDISVAGWSFWPDFSGYEFLVDQQLGAWFYMNNQTIHDLIVKSNAELNATKRAQEISQITLMVQDQAAAVWLGQDNDLPTTGNGVGPTVFNKCITGDPGLWQNPAYWVYVGLDFSTMYYQC
jgi:ABC-type transport system substrate-binding protein